MSQGNKEWARAMRGALDRLSASPKLCMALKTEISLDTLPISCHFIREAALANETVSFLVAAGYSTAYIDPYAALRTSTLSSNDPQESALPLA